MGSQTTLSARSCFKRAKEYFGATEDPDKAGYILPDGTMLDFSGDRGLPEPEKRVALILGTWGRRELDHREINFALTDDEMEALQSLLPPSMPSNLVGMWRFMNLGAIRFSTFSQTIVVNLVKRPTDAQVNRIIETLRKHPDAVLVIEIDDPNLDQITYRDFSYPFTGWRAFVNKAPVLLPSVAPEKASGRVLTLREIAATITRKR